MLTVVSTSSLELFLQPIHSGASCLSRCLIYKVHAALSRRVFIVALSFLFVKHFFQVFLIFFGRFYRGNRPAHSPAALADDLFILPPLPHFVKHFFQIFFDLFSCLTRSGRGDALASRKRFAIIANFSFLVNHFFQFFPSFFHFVLRQPYLLSFARFYTQNVGSDGTSPAPSTRPAPKAAAPAP